MTATVAAVVFIAWQLLAGPIVARILTGLALGATVATYLSRRVTLLVFGLVEGLGVPGRGTRPAAHEAAACDGHARCMTNRRVSSSVREGAASAASPT